MPTPSHLPFIPVPGVDRGIKRLRVRFRYTWSGGHPTVPEHFLADLQELTDALDAIDRWAQTPWSSADARAYCALPPVEQEAYLPPIPTNHALSPWARAVAARTAHHRMVATPYEGTELAHRLLDLYRREMSRIEGFHRRLIQDPPQSPLGRPRGSHGHPTLEAMVQAARELINKTDQALKKDFMRKLGRQHEDPRRVNEWLKPHGMIYQDLVKRLRPPR